MAKTSRRLKKARVDPAVRMAISIGLPKEQAQRPNLVLCDISNHTDSDQRRMVRSGERQTVRRQPKIYELVKRKVLDTTEAAACEWYAAAHAMRYDTTGITANYGAAGGSGKPNFDHLPKNAAQLDAYYNFEFARAGINPRMLPLFERVVLQGRPLGKLTITFRTAVRQLLTRIEGRVQL